MPRGVHMSPIAHHARSTFLRLDQDAAPIPMTHNRSPERIPITAEMVAELRGHMERTSISSMRLLHNAKNKPRGLTSGMIETWLCRAVVTAKPEHFIYAMARWSALPDNPRVALTPDMTALLNAELVRTGLGPVTVLEKIGKRPHGLTWQIVQAWAHGTVDAAYVAHWNGLTAQLRSLPDAAAGPRNGLAGSQARRAITADELAELRAHRERTGIGGAILLRTAADIPAGVTPSMISGWVNASIKSANPDHLAYVLARYRSWS